jgi:hypothetical protein
VVELSRSWIWIFKRKTRVSLSGLEIARVKDALYALRKVKRKHAAITDAIEAWCAGQRASNRGARPSARGAGEEAAPYSQIQGLRRPTTSMI